jgi:hypothetical protein
MLQTQAKLGHVHPRKSLIVPDRYRQARHLLQENHRNNRSSSRDGGIDVDLILPLKFGPHATELSLVAVGGINIVEDVDVDIVEHYAVRVARNVSVVEDVAKDDASLCRRNLKIDDLSQERHLKRYRERNKITLMVVLILWNEWGPNVCCVGRSDIFKSPRVANSTDKF